jgi:hypothetical protein
MIGIDDICSSKEFKDDIPLKGSLDFKREALENFVS